MRRRKLDRSLRLCEWNERGVRGLYRGLEMNERGVPDGWMDGSANWPERSVMRVSWRQRRGEETEQAGRLCRL